MKSVEASTMTKTIRLCGIQREFYQVIEQRSQAKAGIASRHQRWRKSWKIKAGPNPFVVGNILCWDVFLRKWEQSLVAMTGRFVPFFTEKPEQVNPLW